MHEGTITALALVLLAGILCQWFAWWVKLPAILFLLLAGVVAGPLTGLLDPSALFGDLLFPFISLSAAVILFEGSLTLRFHEIAGLERVVRRMVSIGMVVTWLITAVATRFALGFSWAISFLFGAITVVTGPTVVVPILRTVRPTASVANILRWEGIVIEPIGATLAVLVYEFIVSGSGGTALGHTLLCFGQVLAAGLCIGSLAGYLFGLVLREHLLPEFLHSVAALTLVVCVLALSNRLQLESGLLAVTVTGAWLANMKGVPVDEILGFKESLSVLLISMLFIVLAARIEVGTFQELGWPVVAVFVAVQFLARPLNVMAATVGSKLTWPERHLLAWIAPRGIVAAAVSAVFAYRLGQGGYAEARFLVPLTFTIIIGTVALQSGSARLVAKALGVAEPEPTGLLFVGANPLARALAKALEGEGFRVLLVDTSWEDVRAARMEGLPTYFGNPVSEHADRHLDLVGLGRMLAVSPSGELNALATLHYRMEFGRGAVYALRTAAGESSVGNLGVSSRHGGYTLFGEEVTYEALTERLARGWEIRRTRLTRDFDFEQYRGRYGGKAVPLFAIGPKGKLAVFTAERKVQPQVGWTVIGLVPPDGDRQAGTGTSSGPAAGPAAAP